MLRLARYCVTRDWMSKTDSLKHGFEPLGLVGVLNLSNASTSYPRCAKLRSVGSVPVNLGEYFQVRKCQWLLDRVMNAG